MSNMRTFSIPRYYIAAAIICDGDKRLVDSTSQEDINYNDAINRIKNTYRINPVTKKLYKKIDIVDLEIFDLDDFSSIEDADRAEDKFYKEYENLGYVY